jgi:hypothetical protein
MRAVLAIYRHRGKRGGATVTRGVPDKFIRGWLFKGSRVGEDRGNQTKNNGVQRSPVFRED